MFLQAHIYSTSDTLANGTVKACACVFQLICVQPLESRKAFQSLRIHLSKANRDLALHSDGNQLHIWVSLATFRTLLQNPSRKICLWR